MMRNRQVIELKSAVIVKLIVVVVASVAAAAASVVVLEKRPLDSLMAAAIALDLHRYLVIDRFLIVVVVIIIIIIIAVVMKSFLGIISRQIRMCILKTS